MAIQTLKQLKDSAVKLHVQFMEMNMTPQEIQNFNNNVVKEAKRKYKPVGL